MLTVKIGLFTAVYDSKGRVDIFASTGELLDSLLVVVTTEAELRELLTEWLRAS